MSYETAEPPDKLQVKWTRKLGGSVAVFTRTSRNGQQWVLRVEEEKGFVTQQQAAMLLQISLVRVNEWVRYERIPSKNIGGVSMIPLKAIRALYEKRKREGTL
jgi:hypothetical protein